MKSPNICSTAILWRLKVLRSMGTPPLMSVSTHSLFSSPSVSPPRLRLMVFTSQMYSLNFSGSFIAVAKIGKNRVTAKFFTTCFTI